MARVIAVLALLFATAAPSARAQTSPPIDVIRWADGCVALAQEGWESFMELACLAQVADFCMLREGDAGACFAELTAHLDREARAIAEGLPEAVPEYLNPFTARRYPQEREAALDPLQKQDCGSDDDLTPEQLAYVCAMLRWNRVRSLSRLVEN